MKRLHPDDILWMRRALSLARRAEGMTRPNPPVGAIVVRGGQRVGQGWHRKAGGPHAEVFALRQAGRKAQGATLYVTLEPCSTTGRTPPCCEAVHAAGIRRVVVGAVDPNPSHAGRGLRWLRKQGVQVESGVCGEAARELIAPFACHMQEGRPWVTLKLGLSLDGRIADYTHSSRWITGPEAREEVQALRRSCDAILVGAGTVRHDNPSLWPRPDRGRQPWRVVVVRQGDLPLSARIFQDAHAHRTLVAAPRGWRPALATAIRGHGAAVWELPIRTFWKTLSARLAELGILRVLCEGGGILAGEMIRKGWTDELVAFVSPVCMGGPVGAMGSVQWTLPKAPRFIPLESRMVGRDCMLRLRPIREDH